MEANNRGAEMSQRKFEQQADLFQAFVTGLVLGAVIVLGLGVGFTQ